MFQDFNELGARTLFYNIIVISYCILAVMIPLKTRGVWGLGGVGNWGGVSEGEGGLNFNKNPFENNRDKKLKISKSWIFFTQKEHPAPQKMKLRHKKQKIVLPMVILEFGYPSPQLHQTLKPIRDLFCTTVPI